MPVANRLHYYRRVFNVYLMPHRSQLAFWHDPPQVNSHASTGEMGEYYMDFSGKAKYSGPYDTAGIPLLDYRGGIGLQYNPIAIAQWGLGNYNLFRRSRAVDHKKRFLLASDWLCTHLEQNAFGVWVWHHHFDWD